MNKWIAEFDLEDGDTMPEHMDLEYNGAKIDFHCRPMWTPVSEESPKDNRICLVTVELTFARGERYVCRERKDNWDMLKKCGHEVIAWMPLPKPYDPQESEE